jgi:hypothetical protein
MIEVIVFRRYHYWVLLLNDSKIIWDSVSGNLGKDTHINNIAKLMPYETRDHVTLLNYYE